MGTEVIAIKSWNVSFSFLAMTLIPFPSLSGNETRHKDAQNTTSNISVQQQRETATLSQSNNNMNSFGINNFGNINTSNLGVLQEEGRVQVVINNVITTMIILIQQGVGGNPGFNTRETCQCRGGGERGEIGFNNKQTTTNTND